MSFTTDKTLVVLLLGITVLSAAPTPSAPSDKHVSVYSPVAVYSLPVLNHAGHDYVGLLELLEPLGQVSTVANGRSLKLR